MAGAALHLTQKSTEKIQQPNFYQMGGVDTITALDPATDINRPKEWDEARGVLVPIEQYSDGYAYPRRFENGRIGWIRPPMLPSFHQVSRFSRAFQGRSSALGNVGAVAGAREAIATETKTNPLLSAALCASLNSRLICSTKQGQPIALI